MVAFIKHELTADLTAANWGSAYTWASVFLSLTPLSGSQTEYYRDMSHGYRRIGEPQRHCAPFLGRQGSKPKLLLSVSVRLIHG